MLTTLIPAIIGFVGVIVGAVITTGASSFLAVRKEKAEAAAHRLSRARELKTAARLIASELLLAQAGAKIFVGEKRWVLEKIRFPMDAWQRDKGILALELPFEDWNAVEKAALAVEHFRTLHSILRSGDNVSDATAEIGKPILTDIRAGLEALRPHMIEPS
jgi:hypothetical protein